MLYGCMITIGGILGMVITIIGDLIHFMNRDIVTWIYVSEGIIMALVLVSYIIIMFLTRALWEVMKLNI